MEFKWRPNFPLAKGKAQQERQLGFIAQEVEEIYPELVSPTEGDEHKGLKYAGFSAIIVEAVKEQQEVVQQQAAEISHLTQRVELHEREIEGLREQLLTLKKVVRALLRRAMSPDAEEEGAAPEGEEAEAAPLRSPLPRSRRPAKPTSPRRRERAS